jgi:3-hydroxyisobutyrate dehydrogenase
MGASMCKHLLATGFGLAVTTRNRDKAQDVLAAGATWAQTPAEVAAASDVIFSMVGYPNDVREVLLGKDGALLAAAPGAVLVDMTTSQPELAREIAAAALARGVYALDAPVSGGDVGARNGTLSIMVGGEAEVFAAVRPCFEAMGQTIVLQGGPGAGQHTKMVNQILIAGTMVSIAEALVYAYRVGLDVETVLASVGSGAAGSWSLTNYVPRILAGNFAPGFFVDHFVKDLGIALAEARRAGLQLPGTELAERLYVTLQEQGRGRDGTQAIVHALAAISNQPWPPATA